MTWRRVEDTFDVHPKVEALRALGKRRFGQAIALWTLAGCHACREDGTFPESLLPRLGIEAPRRAVADLERVGLVTRLACGPTHGGVRSGVREGVREVRYAFHDWLVYNETPEEKAAKRSRNAARQAEYRRRRNALRDAENNGGVTTPRSRTRPDPDPRSLPADADPRPVPVVARIGPEPPPSPPIPELPSTRDHVRRRLVTAYAECYEARLGQLWQSWAAVDGEARQVAGWVLGQSRKDDRDPMELADQLIIRAWERLKPGQSLHWDKLAKDPASYLRDAPPPKLDREQLVSEMAELRAKAETVRTRHERAKRQGLFAEAEQGQREEEQIWAQYRKLKGARG